MSRVLLLSAWYFPIRILRWQDAIKLKYEGNVDVLAEYDEEVRSPSIVWKMPAVVRLRKQVKTTKRGIRFSRINVYVRDNFTCQYCGNKYPIRALSFDHVVPRQAGGRTTWENIVTSCRTCNTVKDCKSCDAVGMWPLKEPVKPKYLPITGPVINMDSVPEEWVPYIPEGQQT